MYFAFQLQRLIQVIDYEQFNSVNELYLYSTKIGLQKTSPLSPLSEKDFFKEIGLQFIFE